MVDKMKTQQRKAKKHKVWEDSSASSIESNDGYWDKPQDISIHGGEKRVIHNNNNTKVSIIHELNVLDTLISKDIKNNSDWLKEYEILYSQISNNTLNRLSMGKNILGDKENLNFLMQEITNFKLNINLNLELYYRKRKFKQKQNKKKKKRLQKPLKKFLFDQISLKNKYNTLRLKQNMSDS